MFVLTGELLKDFQKSKQIDINSNYQENQLKDHNELDYYTKRRNLSSGQCRVWVREANENELNYRIRVPSISKEGVVCLSETNEIKVDYRKRTSSVGKYRVRVNEANKNELTSPNRRISDSNRRARVKETCNGNENDRRRRLPSTNKRRAGSRAAGSRASGVRETVKKVRKQRLASTTSKTSRGKPRAQRKSKKRRRKISSRSNKMHDNLLILNETDLKRHERFKEKELKKKDPEKENQFQKRKLTNPVDPDSLKMREFKKTEETPNRKIPRNKSRAHGEPLIRNFTSSPQSTWCRVDCYERQHHIASFQMEEAVICVDGTHPFSDKNRIAFAALPSRADDPKVAKVKSCIGKGVQLHQDERQNLWATRLGKNPIFVRGHTLCPELVKLNGKLTQGVPMKVLDTSAFKEYMREEVDNNGGVNEEVKERIISKLKICMSFIKDTAVDEDTPCWFEIWLLKVKDQVKRYLENQQKREKRKSGHLDMRVQTPQESTKRIAAMPEMRRAKSGDHIRMERRPRSNTTNTGVPSDSPSNKVPRPRPPSQNFSHQIVDKSLLRQQQQQQQLQQQQQQHKQQIMTQDMMRREKSMDMIRREKSMDVRVESRMLMEREYRQSMGRPLTENNQINRVRSGNSPGQSPPHSLIRSSSSSNNMKRESTVDSPRLTNGSNTPSPHDPELRRGNSVTAPKAGMSYRQVFGLQSSDYLFNVTPPNYTRHRRFSDSDTESLHNFNFIHKVITPSTPPTSALGRQSPPHQQQQQQQQHSTEDAKGNILSKKWMSKIRRKSEDNPKKKLAPQVSNK